MKGITGYLLAAVVLALVGGALLGVGVSRSRSRSRAGARRRRRSTTTLEPAYETAEQYYDYASHIPGVGDGPANDIRAKQRRCTTGRSDYAAVIPQQTDPVGSVPQDNADLQLVVANAVYRTGQSRMKDKESTIAALDQGIAAVRRRSSRTRRATRTPRSTTNISSGCATKSTRASASPARRRWCSKDRTAPPARRPQIDSSMSDFKIYIPLESQERTGIEADRAGKRAPGTRRKG